jgi:hypothetical protein
LTVAEVAELIKLAKNEGLSSLTVDGCAFTFAQPVLGQGYPVPFLSGTSLAPPNTNQGVSQAGLQLHNDAILALEKAAERLSARDLRFSASG